MLTYKIQKKGINYGRVIWIFEQNPWIIPVGAAVIAVICLLLEIFVFRSRRLDSRGGMGSGREA